MNDLPRLDTPPTLYVTADDGSGGIGAVYHTHVIAQGVATERDAQRAAFLHSNHRTQVGMAVDAPRYALDKWGGAEHGEMALASAGDRLANAASDLLAALSKAGY